MKKRKIAATIAAMVMAATAIQTLSASAIGYLLPKVEDVDKYIEEFASDDEVSKLLEEYYATLEKGDGGIIHILKLPMTETLHNECPNGVYWAFKEYYSGSTRRLSPERVFDPAYYQDFINEDILSFEEFDNMSYEERIIFTVNYYLEHGEYLTMWAVEESGFGFTSTPTSSASASDYLLSYDLDAIRAAIALSGITPVETWNKGSYIVVDDDIEKLMDIFSDDEVAKLLTEHYKEVYSDYVYPYIGTAITVSGRYTPCFIITQDNCHPDVKDNEIWDKYDRILSWGGELYPVYYEEMIKEDILPLEEYEKMSYEERIVYAINYYNEHGEYLIELALAEIDAPVIPLDYGKTLIGDANLDGEMNFADAVCIMQHLANPAKYTIAEQGIKNADTDGNGITLADALKIQQMLLGIE